MKNKFSRLLKYGILATLLLFIVFFIITFSSIYSGVKKTCLTAKKEFSGGCQSALVQYIESESHSIREKNTAIWALGQLADPRSVEFLVKLDAETPSPEECNHDKYPCNYEIQKAIKWSKNGNWTSWMYRNQDRW
jgi:hypothetical protein